MSRTGQALAGAILAAALAILAGCSSGRGDPTPPTPTTTATSAAHVTASPSTTSPTTSHPSTEPKPAPTKRGARRAALATIRAINLAYETSSVAPLERIAERSCQFCEQIIHEFPAKRRAGYSIRGGQIIPKGRPTISVRGSVKTRYVVTTHARVLPLKTMTPSGRLFKNDKDLLGSGSGSPDVVFDIEVLWTHNEWKANKVNVHNED